MPVPTQTDDSGMAYNGTIIQKLLLIQSSLVIITMLLVFGMLEYSFYQSKTAELENNLDQMLNTQKSAFSNALWEVDIKQLKSMVNEIGAKNPNVDAIDVGDNRGVVMTSWGIGQTSPASSYLSKSILLTHDDNVLGTLHITLHNRRVISEIEHHILEHVILLLGVLAALLGGVYFYTTRLIQKPLRLLISEIRKVRGGDYIQPVTWKSNDELGEFIELFNELQKAQASANAKVAEFNHQLLDVVEQRTAELNKSLLAAEDANHAKTAFLATMSHEIRTPMNGILGMLTLLERTELTNRQRDYAGKAKSVAHALLGIINDVLDFSKVEAGKIELEYCRFSINDMMEELSALLSASLGKQKIELLIAIDPAIPESIIGDPLRLRQVLINLANNAMKFTEQGEVMIALRLCQVDAEKATIEFSVADTGIGIPGDKLDTIFEGFSQAEASITRRFGGTGLGLAISKRLVELMAGKLGVASEIGKGSRFFFRLSFNLPPDSLIVASETVMPLQAQHLHALIVDDNTNSRTILQNIAAAAHWQSHAVDSGEAAIGYLQSAPPPDCQMIIMDWDMPEMDGWQTARRLYMQQGENMPPILMLVTAHDLALLTEKPQAEINQLLDGYLIKPVTASMLYDAVQKIVSAREELQLSQEVPRLDQQLSGMHLLVVDDNQFNQEIAGELLASCGATVSIASNGLDGIQQALAASPPFDAILMDIQMPEMDGLEATRRLLTHPVMHTTPIIAMTANALPSDRAACIEAGMVDHVAKPFDLAELVNKICLHVVRQRRLVMR